MPKMLSASTKMISTCCELHTTQKVKNSTPQETTMHNQSVSLSSYNKLICVILIMRYCRHLGRALGNMYIFVSRRRTSLGYTLTRISNTVKISISFATFLITVVGARLHHPIRRHYRWRLVQQSLTHSGLALIHSFSDHHSLTHYRG